MLRERSRWVYCVYFYYYNIYNLFQRVITAGEGHEIKSKHKLNKKYKFGKGKTHPEEA